MPTGNLFCAQFHFGHIALITATTADVCSLACKYTCRAQHTAPNNQRKSVQHSRILSSESRRSAAAVKD